MRLLTLFCLFAFLTLPSLIGQGEPVVEFVGIKAPNEKIVRLDKNRLQLGGIILDQKNKELSFPAIYSPCSELEVLIAHSRGRVHESLIQSNTSPFQLELMLYLLGADSKIKRKETAKKGSIVDIDLEWKNADSTISRAPVEDFIFNNRRGSVMKRKGWHFPGSPIVKTYHQAEGLGNLVLLYSNGPTVLDNFSQDSEFDGNYVPKKNKLRPVPGSPIRVVLTVRPKK